MRTVLHLNPVTDYLYVCPNPAVLMGLKKTAVIRKMTIRPWDLIPTHAYTVNPQIVIPGLYLPEAAFFSAL